MKLLQVHKEKGFRLTTTLVSEGFTAELAHNSALPPAHHLSLQT